MSIYLGGQPVTLYLNGTEAAVAGVYLGGVQVVPAGATVPGAPAIVSANENDGTAIWTAPASDGGSAILVYRIYLDGVFEQETALLSGDVLFAGQVVEVSAVNAIGEGPKSEPFVVTLS